MAGGSVDAALDSRTDVNESIIRETLAGDGLIRLIDARGADLSAIARGIKRAPVDAGDVSDRVKAGIRKVFGEDLTPVQVVERILGDVRARGDQAVMEYTLKIDGVDLSAQGLVVAEEELEEAASQVSEEFLAALRYARRNIEAFHLRQVRQSWVSYEADGVVLGQRHTPMDVVGVYVPGGTAAYPSSVLMNVVPAKVAGVGKVVMATPPGKAGKVNPYILAAAKEAGVDLVVRAGGAQAIAALAYGTETIPKVDKIFGPGNIFVTIAKKLVYGTVGVDMVAGPSEIFVIADGTANPKFVAADLLSQAEHDTGAAAVLVTWDEGLAGAVAEELARQLKELSRVSIAAESLRAHGRIVVVSGPGDAARLANEYAPEHLELAVEDPFALVGLVRHAGTVFLGHYTPESVGDYTAGSNHVLPTNGTARFSSALGVDDFMKRTNIVFYTKEALSKAARATVTLAEAEGLGAHARAVTVRVGDGDDV